MDRVQLVILLLAICVTATSVLNAQPAPGTTTCPVTLRPEKEFLPPFPYLLRPPDPVSFWYGTHELWTQVWAPPPWTPWKPQERVRTYWASAEKSNDEQPSLVVSIKRLDVDEPTETFTPPDSVAFTPKRFGMIASVTFPSAGCWQVTGTYRGTVLNYVVNIEPASSPRNSSQGQEFRHSLLSSEDSVFGPETRPRRPPAVSRSTGRRFLNCHFTGRVKAADLPSVCAIACGGDLAPCTLKQLKLLHDNDLARIDRHAEARRLLLQHAVPFDPNILLEHAPRGRVLPDWSLKLVLDQMPEMKQILRMNLLSDVVMADTLYLPENVKIGPGPVIVIVKHLVVEGCNLGITNNEIAINQHDPWGTNGTYFYSVGEGRFLGMSLGDALKKNHLKKDQFPGRDHLPTFSTIRDLDLPKCKRANINVNMDGGPNGLTPPALWPDPPELPEH